MAGSGASMNIPVEIGPGASPSLSLATGPGDTSPELFSSAIPRRAFTPRASHSFGRYTPACQYHNINIFSLSCILWWNFIFERVEAKKNHLFCLPNF